MRPCVCAPRTKARGSTRRVLLEPCDLSLRGTYECYRSLPAQTPTCCPSPVSPWPRGLR